MHNHPNNYTTILDVVNKAKEAVGHRIGEFNIYNRSMIKGKNKGVIGQIMEEGFFHYPINSRPGADFESLGVELKVAGIKETKKNELVFKERLVLNVINYLEESTKTFKTSAFWTKNKNLLFILYLYELGRLDCNFPIVKSFLHQFSEADLNVIMQDWRVIHNKICKGLAHTISESDTLFLGACTKGSKAHAEMRVQPNTDIKAQQRAYCLKKTYLDRLLDKNEYESIMANAIAEIKDATFEMYIKTKLDSYKGKTEAQLRQMFGLESKTMKNIFSYLVGKMLGLKGPINKTLEFVKGGLILKTIRLEENNTIREHLSFPYINYQKIIHENWNNSDFKNYLENSKFMFIVFKKKNNEYTFEKTVFWHISDEILEGPIKQVWQITHDLIKNGTIVKEIEPNGRYRTYFPSSTFNHICHVRPHDIKSISNSNRGMQLPVSDRMTGLKKYTKHCFWLDKVYIAKIINKEN